MLQMNRTLTPTTDSHIKEIFPDEADYDLVRDEMTKVPKCMPDSFVKLYDELEKETEDEEEDTKREKK